MNAPALPQAASFLTLFPSNLQAITMYKMSFLARAMCAGLPFVAACHDIPTAVDTSTATPGDAVVPRLSSAAQSEEFGRTIPDPTYYCRVLTSSGEGGDSEPAESVLEMRFPTGSLPTDGATTTYHLRFQRVPERPSATADCVIPRTTEAIRFLETRLHVPKDAQRVSRGNSGTGGLSTMGCVYDGTACSLEGLTVVAPPPVYCPRGSCWERGTGSEGYGSGGGGSAGGWIEPPTECNVEDLDCDGDTADEGPVAFAACVAVKLGPGGWAAVIGTGLGAYQLLQARLSVRQTYHDWQRYYSSPTWNYATDLLYQTAYENAVSQESLLWAATGAAAGIAAWEIGKAAVACAPTWAAPV